MTLSDSRDGSATAINSRDGSSTAINPREVLNVAARIAATEAEGPGLRYALWVQGCPLRCDGCCNPGMLPFTAATELTVSEVVGELCSTPLVDGVTFLGGEPFAQAEPLARVARAARERGLSVLVFSGYTLEELRAAARPAWTALLAATDLLVDGRYEVGNPAVLRFVGSANQRLHALTARGAALACEFEGGPDIVEVRIDGAPVPVADSSASPVRGVSVTINGTPDAISVNGTPDAISGRCEPRPGEAARKR